MTWSDIPGWFDYSDIYDSAVESAPSDEPSVFVEIGTAFGRSIAYLARRCIDSRKPIKLYCVDPWVDDCPDNHRAWDEASRPTWGAEHAPWARSVGGPYSAFLEAMRAHAPEELEFIRPLRCYSVDAAKMFDRAHFVFIDGDHKYEAVKSDIAAWASRAVNIAGHDYTHEFPGVQQAVREAFGPLPATGTSWVRR